VADHFLATIVVTPPLNRSQKGIHQPHLIYIYIWYTGNKLHSTALQLGEKRVTLRVRTAVTHIGLSGYRNSDQRLSNMSEILRDYLQYLQENAGKRTTLSCIVGVILTIPERSLKDSCIEKFNTALGIRH
jgi:hypothetical protein